MTDVLQATTPISDDLSRLRLLLEKARTVHEEVNQDFFRFPATDSFTDKDKATILYNYDTASVKADIVDDYLILLDQTLGPLIERVNLLRDELRKEENTHD